ncbi:MAG: hypothetical protein ACO3SP_03530 [Ilumatobacteraceae bacterium]
MTLDAIVFGAVVGLRCLVPLRIPRYPLPAILICALIDALDQSIFTQFTHLDLSGYQTYDKALDVFYLSIAYVSVLRNWVDGPLVLTAMFLWYYRLFGVVLFEFTGERWYLVAFANTFEYFFVAVEIYRMSRRPDRLTWRPILLMAAGIWMVIKIPQELWIHVAQWDLTDEVKKRLFGAAADASWAEAFTNRPLVTGAAAVLATMLGERVHRWWRRSGDEARSGRLESGHDWPRTMDADLVGYHLGWDPPGRVVRPTATFGWSFLEKVILTTLIAMILANLLPAFDVGAGALALGTIVVIVLNTFLSEWLNERRVTMRTLRVLYVLMVVVNLATVLVFYALLGGNEAKIRFGNTALFVALLTLIVVLFDRYRQVSRLRRGPLFILDERGPEPAPR